MASTWVASRLSSDMTAAWVRHESGQDGRAHEAGLEAGLDAGEGMAAKDGGEGMAVAATMAT